MPWSLLRRATAKIWCSLEAYVSVLASEYTNGLALELIRLLFKYLPSATMQRMFCSNKRFFIKTSILTASGVMLELRII